MTAVDPYGPAAEAGLRPGDIVREVNRRPVRSTRELQDALRQSDRDALLLVQRGDATMFQLLKRS